MRAWWGSVLVGQTQVQVPRPAVGPILLVCSARTQVRALSVCQQTFTRITREFGTGGSSMERQRTVVDVRQGRAGHRAAMAAASWGGAACLDVKCTPHSHTSCLI